MKYRRHLHFVSIYFMSLYIDFHHFSCSSSKIISSFSHIVLPHCPLKFIIARAYLIFICSAIWMKTISWSGAQYVFVYSKFLSEFVYFRFCEFSDWTEVNCSITELCKKSYSIVFDLISSSYYECIFPICCCVELGCSES